jgi:hypothetical protein
MGEYVVGCGQVCFAQKTQGEAFRLYDDWFEWSHGKAIIL